MCIIFNSDLSFLILKIGIVIIKFQSAMKMKLNVTFSSIKHIVNVQ